LLESVLHKFYAASVSIGLNGSMTVAGTRERALVWGILFCLAAASSLVVFLFWRKHHLGKLGVFLFVITLMIPVLIIPSVGREYIYATPTTMIIESGRWYRPSQKIVSMSGIRRIREVDRPGLLPANLLGDPRVTWHLTWNDGSSEILHLNDFFNAHRMVVAYYYKDRGFRLERLEDRPKQPM